ncbi:MAG: hypothetical protein ALAOOOJD_02013 [bacterium]|nr:hypothetical protein [bacterium]
MAEPAPGRILRKAGDRAYNNRPASWAAALRRGNFRSPTPLWGDVFSINAPASKVAHKGIGVKLRR